MSVLSNSWLRNVTNRAFGRRSRPAARRRNKDRRPGRRILLEALESRAMPVTGLTVFAPGAYVVDMGQATQTVANSLKPYGLVYDLVQNQHIPVDWAINPNKGVFGADFTAGGVTYSGGPFIIEAPFAAAAAATIAKWRAQGVVVTQVNAAFVAPIYNTITSFPRTVLDRANGKIAQAYYTLAGIPQFSSTVQDPTKAAYVFGTPLDLNQCNDIYVLPHADPSLWPAAYKTSLFNFINSGGWLYQACHSVSDLDVNGAELSNLLSSGLILFKNHKAGTPPYNYNPTTADDPEMQFMSRIDAATQNGSEQIYVPSATGAWLPTTSVGVYDPDQPNATGTTLGKVGSVLTYGPAFGDPTKGWVMYEGGHSLAGTAPANVGAMRAFFDFILHAGIAHTPQIDASSFPPTLAAGASGTVSATIGLGSMRLVSYQWTSTNGGTFSDQSAVTDPATGAVTITATFTAANLPTTIKLVATDDCGHQVVLEQQILATPPPVNRPPVAVNDSYTTTQDRALIVSTAATSLLHNDSDPDGDPLIVSRFDTTSAHGGTVAVNPDGTFTYTPAPGFTGTDTFTYTISDGRGGFATATATITVNPTPPPAPAAPPDAKDDNYQTNPTTPILGQNILGNDILNFGTITGISNLNHIVQWDGNPANVPPSGTAYFTIDLTTGTVDFYPNGYTGAAPQFDYTLTNSRGSDHATVKFDIKTDAPLANEDYSTVAGYTTGQTPTSVIIPISDNDISNNPNFVGWSQPVITGLPAGATATVVQIGTNEFGQPIWGIKYTPAANHFTGPNQAPDTFQYKVTELVRDPNTGVIKNGKDANTNVFVTVTNVPTANNDIFEVPQNSGPTTLDVLQNDSAAGSPIRLQSVNVTNGTTENGGAVFISDDGLTVIYEPAQGFTGTDTFTYTIIDGNGNTSTATVTINVPPVPNQPPVAVDDVQDPIPNNSSVPVGDTVTDNDSDPDRDPLTVTTIESATGGTVAVPEDRNTPATIAGDFGTLVIDSFGSYTYQLDITDPEVAGLPIGGTIEDVFTYTISDGHGGTDTATLTVPITRVNQPPVAADDAYTTTPDTALTVLAPDGVLANDTDPDPEHQGHLTVVSVNRDDAAVGQQIRLPSGALVTVNPDGSFSYDPNGAFDNLAPGTSGTDSFTYAVEDPSGGVSTATAVITIAAPEADLAVTKEVSNPRPQVGDTITFTITVTNNGPDTAQGVEVTDDLLPGLTLVDAVESQGTYIPTTGVWAVGDLASGASATLTLTVTVDSTDALTNTATITGGDRFDPNPNNNTATITTTPQAADLVVNKTVSNPTPNVGDTVTFTVTLTNNGPDAATGVRLIDLLPAGLTFVSATTTLGTYDSGTGLWDVGTIPNGVTLTLTLVATVVSPLAETNTAKVDAVDQFDPNPNDNTASTTTTPQQSDLAVTKEVSNPTPNVGDNVTFTVTLTNRGPDPATGVQLTEQVPLGLTFVSANPSQGTYNSATGLWDVGTVPVTVGSPLTLEIVARVASPNRLTNTVSVSRSDQFDPTPGDNTASGMVTPQQADLSVAKAVSDPEPQVGQTITFTIILHNNGPDAATGVTVTDQLPAGVTFVSSSGPGSYNPTTGVWTVGTVDSETSATLTITATVTSVAAIVNTASVSHSDQFDPNINNNSATTSSDPQSADLVVEKTVSDRTPNVGDQVTFTVTLTNLGTHEATGVQVTDLLPRGLVLVSQSPPGATTYDPATGLWTVGTVPVDTPLELTLVARVASVGGPPNGELTNTASVTRSDQFDPNTGNNSDTEIVTPQQADLAVTKTVSDPRPNVGDTVTFTITLSNAGPDPATNVTVADVLPAGLTFLSSSDPGAFDPTTRVWTVGTVSPNGPLTLTITARVDQPVALTNTARIDHSDQFDPDTSNNTSSVTTTPQQSDLRVVKTVDNPTPGVGDTITYTITVTNLGPDTATGVQLTDRLQSNLNLLLARTSAGRYDPGTGIWDVGTLLPGESRSLMLTAVVGSPAALTNTASITRADQFDPDEDNNTSTVTATPLEADLGVTKTVSDQTPNVGDTVTFTVTLSNAGPGAGTNVTVGDLLPAGMTFVSSSDPAAYDPGTGVWTVGTIDPNTPVTLTITATVDEPGAGHPGALTNTATILGADQSDPNDSNNTSSVTTTPQQSDLQVTKAVNDPTPNVGDTITFTVRVTNLGPDDATGVQIADPLPAGLDFVSATLSPATGTYNSATGVWTIGTLANTATATLTVRAIVRSEEPETNTATTSASDQFDPDSGNNSASAEVTPEEADLAVAKTVSDPTPNVDDVITFTVTLTNHGPNEATGVTLNDRLLAGLAFVGAEADHGTFNGGTGVWNVGTIGPGDVATLTIRARVTGPNAVTNTAGITHSDQEDPDTSNDTAETTVTPQQADLAVTKVVSDATPDLGDVIAYTITLTNLGPSDATGVLLRDRVPAGLAFVSAAPSQGTYDPATGIWTVGDVADGFSATLVLNARVTGTAPGTNSATITNARQFDPNTANNTASAPLNAQQVDLVVTKSVSNPRPNQDEVVTFTVSVTNRGPSTATGVSLKDLVPAGLEVLRVNPSQGVYDPATGFWTIGAVTTVTPATLQIEARVITPARKVNRAAIMAVDQRDSNLANNAARVIVTPRRANLAVFKTVDHRLPDVGGTVVFRVRVLNRGPDAATGVQLTDLLPAGLSLVSADPSQGTYDPASGVWTVGMLANLAAANLFLTARVDTPAPATNTAAVSAADQFDPVPANNSRSVTVTPRLADLAVTKSVSNPTPNVGDIVTFTVTVRNNGPTVARNVQLTDQLPAGYTFISATRTRGVFTPATGLWTFLRLPVGATARLTIRARLDAPTAEPNVATVTAMTFDPDTSNNSAQVGTTAQQADVALTKEVDNPTPNVGDTVTFTLTVSNTGPDTATNVRVTDLLPAGLTFAGATPSQGTFASATGLWTVGAIASGGEATLTVRATVTAPGQLDNTAAATADQFDPVPENNSASEPVTPLQADLVLGKSVDNPTPNVGDTVNFTVLVRNSGPDPATNVVVTDQLPAGLEFVSDTPTQGTYDSATGLWTVGDLGVDGEARLTIAARVTTAGEQLNLARVTGADQFDPDTSNNTASAAENGQQAELVLTKAVDNPRPNVGDTVTYTVLLSNLGPSQATGVQVADALPTGLTNVSVTPDTGTSFASGVWNVGTVPVGETRQLTITGTVSSPSTVVNTATISHVDQPDPNPQNDQGSATITPQQADLAVFKSVDNRRPNVGDTVRFTVTLVNRSRDTATNVAVMDLLPAGFALVSDTPSTGTYDPATGLWSVGSVGPRRAETLVLEATVLPDAVTLPNATTNVATVTHSDQFDPNDANNSSQLTVTPREADLRVTKNVSDPTPNVGDVVTFTVTLNNFGPDASTGVQLTDLLPAGLTLVSAAPDQGTYTAATGVWDVGTVLANHPVDLVLRALVEPPPAGATSTPTLTNTATVTANDVFDPNAGNNTGNASLTARQADLRVNKEVDNPRPNVGDTVTFTVTVTNIGPDSANGVSINDVLPHGLAFVSATPSQGAYARTTGVWTVGTIESAEIATLEITARVTGPQPLTNTADVRSAAEFDPNKDNNTSSVEIEPQVANLAITKAVDIPKPDVGDTVTFTVTVTNNGPDEATGVVVTDFIPVSLQLLTQNATVGTYDPATGTWTIGTLANGGTATLTLTARVISPNAATNQASVRSDQFDPDLNDNTGSAEVVPPQADLVLTKTPSARVVNVGSTMFFTLNLQNIGPDAATNVFVTDRLPAGLTFVRVNDITQGTFDPATGQWSVGDLSPGATARLRIAVRVAREGSFANSATTTLDEFDPVSRNNRPRVVITAVIPGKGGLLT